MKVLMINSVCGIRSTGRICTDIAETLEAQGHTCKIAYGRESVPQKYEKYAVRIGTDTGVKIHGALSRVFDTSGFHSRLATKKFIKWVKQYDPDVIHLHNIHGYYLHVGELFKYLKTCGKKILWTLHDCWAFTGHCSHFDFVGCEKWKTGCYKCSQKKRYPASLLRDRSKKNYSLKKKWFTGIDNVTIITPSQWLADIVKQSFLGEYTVEVVRNGIDLNVFKPTESDFRVRYGLEDKKILLGVASTWEERKGLADFLKLAEMVDENYAIVLVGLNEKQMQGLPKNVIGITRTNSTKELAQIYTTADVFLNLSYEETMGLVTVEAMACGTPAIVYDKTAVPEVVNETCGIIVKAGDVEEVCKKLRDIDFDSVACQKKAQEYEKIKQYKKYLGMYYD